MVRGLLPLPPSLTHFTSRLYYYYVQYKRSLSPWSADENDRRYVKCVFGMCNFPPPRERSIVSPRTSASEPVLSLFFAKRAAYLADPLSRRNDLALDLAGDKKKRRACGRGVVSRNQSSDRKTVTRGIPERRVIHRMIVSNYSLHTSDR